MDTARGDDERVSQQQMTVRDGNIGGVALGKGDIHYACNQRIAELESQARGDRERREALEAALREVRAVVPWIGHKLMLDRIDALLSEVQP